MFPDFIIIGAMKCGTSSLYHYLHLHPEIGMSDFKEVDYFVEENNFNKGAEWYEARFHGAFEHYGEVSPNYSKAHFFRGVPQRMHSLLPGVKLIYLVRDPVERLISHYTHNYSEGREHNSISEALSGGWDDNHYIMCSRYYWQLEHYLKFFPQEQILVVPSFRLKFNRKAALERIFRFIGVDDSFYTEAYSTQLHKTDRKRRKGRVARYILESPVIKTLKGYLPDEVKDPVKRWTRPEVQKPELPAHLREKLRDYFRPDIEALQRLTGETFNDWTA